MAAGCLVIVLVAAAIMGCQISNKSGLTVDEPEITVDYLEGDYVKQLIRDGAEHVFGKISMSEDAEGNMIMNIKAMEYVADDSSEKGYYLEDRNMNFSYGVDSEARCTFISGSVSLPQIVTADKFYENIKKLMKSSQEQPQEDLDNPEDPEGTQNQEKENFVEDRYFDIYVMGDQVELVLEKYIN